MTDLTGCKKCHQMVFFQPPNDCDHDVAVWRCTYTPHSGPCSPRSDWSHKGCGWL